MNWIGVWFEFAASSSDSSWTPLAPVPREEESDGKHEHAKPDPSFCPTRLWRTSAGGDRSLNERGGRTDEHRLVLNSKTCGIITLTH